MPFADRTHLTCAAQAVDDLLAHLSGDDWMAPTPCTGWSVADVTQHLVDVNLTFAQQIHSAGAETPVGTSTPGDLLDSYRRSTEALQQALTVTAEPATDIAAPLRSRLALRVADLLIHGWDIAVATGKPLHLAEDLCAQALAFAQSRSAALQRSGQFAAPQPVDEHAPAIDRLAALSGRPPSGVVQ
ncbi:MAG: TIGR03086 family metal-binding protein [Actinomycetota bacterium]|nr:TIGR03086 family metal-binding protein [Actinomycetota bacterium]